MQVTVLAATGARPSRNARSAVGMSDGFGETVKKEVRNG